MKNVEKRLGALAEKFLRQTSTLQLAARNTFRAPVGDFVVVNAVGILVAVHEGYGNVIEKTVGEEL